MSKWMLLVSMVVALMAYGCHVLQTVDPDQATDATQSVVADLVVVTEELEAAIAEAPPGEVRDKMQAQLTKYRAMLAEYASRIEDAEGLAAQAEAALKMGSEKLPGPWSLYAGWAAALIGFLRSARLKTLFGRVVNSGYRADMDPDEKEAVRVAQGKSATRLVAELKGETPGLPF